MGAALQRAWLRRGALAWLLWPLSLLFALLAALRRGAFRAGLLRAEHVGVPVVIIGNVIAGGSGKTPIVRAVTEHLKARGLRVGVVSRGYGRTGDDCREVRPDSQAREVGDEPLLIARSCGVPVFVARRRAEAARALLHEHPRTQLIVSDDGLQHYALARDLEICVFDDRGVGNGWLLPAGPLREPWPRPVDLVLRTPGAAVRPGFEVRRRLGAQAWRADGTRVALDSLRGREFCALAGIANPEVFFTMLREAGLAPARTIALPDHHDFAQPPDFPGELVCTEKDAVKLWRSRPDAWAVPLEVAIEDGFWRAFDRLVDAKL
ncbi:tetraacyldisaccharide 4'-kinase [Ramlibacter solisilvae]|uniref:Tetraacyldisaccharide 4'-kinase n=1 Tax=Ramlibacter tataouinensis TaxID=94132 RepID=A0A127JNB4_9BURK|nr:tetraacyldisaccharide 4'-kinase [Ramlibacter tataouinensis]AMO21549.1 tetraacyldisaccharide 4'-kinase [Ramlibacter tataouinensis]